MKGLGGLGEVGLEFVFGLLDGLGWFYCGWILLDWDFMFGGCEFVCGFIFRSLKFTNHQFLVALFQIIFEFLKHNLIDY